MSKAFCDEIKELLQKQFTSFKKKQLTAIYQKVAGTPLEQSKTKSFIFQTIAQKIAQKVRKLKEQAAVKDKISLTILQQFQALGLKLSSPKKTHIQNIVTQQIDGAFPLVKQSKLPSSSSSQDTIVNIWQENFKIQCICQQPSKVYNKTSSQQPCYKCGRMFHVDCFWDKENDEFFQCPFCFLKNYNPTKEVKEVLFAGYVPKSMKRQKTQFKVIFNASYDIKKDKNIIIEARSARLSSKSRFQLTWPNNCTIYLAGKTVGDFKALPKNSPLKRRNDEQVRLQKGVMIGQNQLILEEKGMGADQRNTKVGRYDHIIMIVAATTKTQQSITQAFQHQIVSQNQCRKIYKKYINRSSSSEVLVQKLSVSLQCQYFAKKILWPVRSKHCVSHYQPFDLGSFMSASFSSKSAALKWKCPICRKRAYDLVVDQFLLNYIRKNTHRNIKEIIIGAQDEDPQIIDKQIEKDISSFDEQKEKEKELMQQCINIVEEDQQKQPIQQEEQQEGEMIERKPTNKRPNLSQDQPQRKLRKLRKLGDFQNQNLQEQRIIQQQNSIEQIFPSKEKRQNNQIPKIINILPSFSNQQQQVEIQQKNIPKDKEQKSIQNIVERQKQMVDTIPINNQANNLMVISPNNQFSKSSNDQLDKNQADKITINKPVADIPSRTLINIVRIKKNLSAEQNLNQKTFQLNQNQNLGLYNPQNASIRKDQTQKINQIENGQKINQKFEKIDVQIQPKKNIEMEFDRPFVKTKIQPTMSKQIQTIQIESDDEPQENIQFKKLQEEKNMLDAIKKSISKKYNSQPISQTDSLIFQNICLGFLELGFKD